MITETNQTPEVTTPPTPSGPKLVGVRFQKAGKPYHFTGIADPPLSVGDWVIVETVYGEQAGVIAYTTHKFPDHIQPGNLKPVLRRANGLDMARYGLMQERAEQMRPVATEELRALNLDAKTVSVEFTLDGKNAIVLYIGTFSKRDLATLRRRLITRMGCQVEIRVVGPRDQAKIQGGYGICGEERCCVRFLTEFQAVSIRMAKDQAISMAPTDITGMCGRLRCCLGYEHEVYQEASKSLPRIKSRVETAKGVGRVIDLDILKAEIIVEIPPDGPRRERERFRFSAGEVTEIKSRK